MSVLKTKKWNRLCYIEYNRAPLSKITKVNPWLNYFVFMLHQCDFFPNESIKSWVETLHKDLHGIYIRKLFLQKHLKKRFKETNLHKLCIDNATKINFCAWFRTGQPWKIWSYQLGSPLYNTFKHLMKPLSIQNLSIHNL